MCQPYLSSCTMLSKISSYIIKIDSNQLIVRNSCARSTISSKNKKCPQAFVF